MPEPSSGTGPSRLRAVLFDAAGTLIELAEPLGETYARFARRFGVELPAWRLADAFSRVFRAAPPMVFPNAAPGEVSALERRWWRGVVRQAFLAADSTVRFTDFDACFERLYDHYAQAAAWRARDGAAEALEDLDAGGLALGVVSNFDQRLPLILAGLGLAKWLGPIVLPAEARAAKPDPAIFRCALARLGVAAEQTLFVGDDAARDTGGAHSAGLHAIDVADLATLAELRDRLAAPKESAG